MKKAVSQKVKKQPAKWYKPKEAEIREAQWLVKQGDFESLEDYIYRTSIALYGAKRKAS